MPDYSTSKVDSKVIGTRMAAILKEIQEMKATDTSMGALSVIQAQQIDGMAYCTYDTALARNAKNLEKAQLVFVLTNGVSEDIASNDFFTNVCR